MNAAITTITAPTNDIAAITVPKPPQQSLCRLCHHNHCANAAIAARQRSRRRNPCANAVAAAITAVANQPRRRNCCTNAAMIANTKFQMMYEKKMPWDVRWKCDLTVL
jgi:hypothetical protein